ncbi:hypothetical protein DKE50_021345 (plasmid) [Acinetobacter nosocomialis]|nr:hypothetical protein DKE50_021345 [Acinetobacter nosocomialis]
MQGTDFLKVCAEFQPKNKFNKIIFLGIYATKPFCLQELLICTAIILSNIFLKIKMEFYSYNK